MEIESAQGLKNVALILGEDLDGVDNGSVAMSASKRGRHDFGIVYRIGFGFSIGQRA